MNQISKFRPTTSHVDGITRHAGQFIALLEHTAATG